MPKLVLLFAALLSLVVPTRGLAHEGHDFEPLSEVLRTPRPTGRMLFFALSNDFETTSPYALVPAAGRRIAWVPDSTQLPEREVDGRSLRAIGSPPPDPTNARYLVPVLDGTGASLHFSARKLETGTLIPVPAGATPGPAVVPVYVGPQLPVASSSSDAAVLDAPVNVDKGELTELAPTLLVRRAPPSRVVFGVQLSAGYAPLIDGQGVAFSARYKGRLGLAVAEVPGVSVLPPDDEDDRSADGSRTGLVVGGVVVGVALVAVGLFLRRRRVVEG